MHDINTAAGPGVDDRLRKSLARSGFQFLTDVQYKALTNGVAAGRSLVVCAPTSSGKTLVGEIAVIQSLRCGSRCLYLVSHKALADQKHTDFEASFSRDNADPVATIALSTGDREEGDLQADVLIATYEKALVLLLSRQIDPTATTVVADELQIISEPSRGPNIETLCAILRQRGTRQFVALTATVENPADLASWLRCDLVQSGTRDVDLHQEIWHDGRGYRVTFGQEEGNHIRSGDLLPTDMLGAVNYLLDHDLSPVLVFTESRREASQHAVDYAQGRQRHASGIAVGEQLNLFSEPTEVSDRLRTSAERRIATHSADLTSQERQVIERGFVDGCFDVCFATSTLAAGVNFPFKTVVFSKLTYAYGDRQGTRITRRDYRNMSGRAGRLGMHDAGYAILQPHNAPERVHARNLVLPQNDRVDSQLPSLTMRRTVLVLLAAGVASTADEFRIFFENTYFCHQLIDRQANALEAVMEKAQHALTWLVEGRFAEQYDDTYLVTPLGQATARSGLLPMTARAFVRVLEEHGGVFETGFDEIIAGLIHWICCSDEFSGAVPSRFLPYPVGGANDRSAGFVAGQRLLTPLDRANNRLCQSVHALIMFVQGTAERGIFHTTSISSGNVHRLALDVSWILDGLHAVVAVPDVRCSQRVGNQISMLARRVRWGAPAESLDLIRIAERAGVPGFGRQRAMAVLESGANTLEEVENLGMDALANIVQSRRRAEALLAAVQEHIGLSANRHSAVYERLAAKLGLADIVKACSGALRKDYEDAIVRLLQSEEGWTVTVLDDGRRQNVPDVMLEVNGVVALLEIKTTSRHSGLVKKEGAFAVLQKAADYDGGMRRVTLGKPHFDETSRKKAMASDEISLVEHTAFVEGVLRVRVGELTPEQFVAWLTEPGVAEVERLLGTPTTLLA